MEEGKYLRFNGRIALFTAFLGGMMMAETNQYTYLFLVIVVAVIGFRDLMAAFTIYDE